MLVLTPLALPVLGPNTWTQPSGGPSVAPWERVIPIRNGDSRKLTMPSLRIASLAAMLMLLFSPLCASGAGEPAGSGKVTGGKITEHPSWFKESFLDLAADVDEANAAGKHLILFMEMNACPYCFKMVEENFKQAPYRDFIRENFDVIAINIKGDREVAVDAETSVTEKQLAGMLGVRYTPTVVFLNRDNKPVARVDGYRNLADFKRVLDYVHTRAYEQQTLADYLIKTPSEGVYAFREHPQLKPITDLKSVPDKPLAVLFEDSGCVACDALHDGHLKDPEINRVLQGFIFVRLDVLSSEPITDVDGNRTTPKAYAEKLGVTYRPTIILFDRGKEIARIEGMLYRYHFAGVLEYVGGRHYEQYPRSPFDYINAKTEEILKSGKDVNIAE